MKKSFLYTSLLAVVMVLSGCTKDTETLDSKNPYNHVTKSGGSPGELHNKMAMDYISQYGLNSDHSLSTNDMTLMLRRIGDIAKARGVLDANADVSDMADGFVRRMEELGFVDNGVLKSPDALNDMAIQSIENSNIRSAFSQIYDLARNDDEHFLDKSKAILASIPNLTQEEKLRLAGAQSVLEHSYGLWNQMRPNGGAAIVAFSDFSYYYYHSITIIETTDAIYVIEEEFVSVTFSLFVAVMYW